jgi:predicted nuclease of restriction endonuclease-like (RecB) superfamily
MIKKKEVDNDNKTIISDDYKSTLIDLKKRIAEAQIKAAISVNKELVLLYWNIGDFLWKKQQNSAWGEKVIDTIAKDIKESFPDLDGFSSRNIRFMIQFAREYRDIEIVKQLVSLIPWGHNIILIQKVTDQSERLWYAQQTIENGWSRSMLDTWINSDLYSRQGKSINNFKATLPDVQSDLAEQTLKDPYNFSFLALDSKHRERELEQGLVDHIQKFLLELGGGFAFVGRQYKVEVSGEDHFIDLLFYNFKLRCFFVCEIKATPFDPRDAGQMNFYLSAVDDLLKQPDDNPSIGIILCKSKDEIKAEYALRRISSPIGVSSYETEIVKKLPKELKASLPTVEEIERELERT